MALVPDPIFFPRVVRNQGVRKVAFFIENSASHDCVVRLESVDCPDWLYLEEVTEVGEAQPVHPGRVMVFPKRARKRFISNVSSGHPFLPKGRSSTDEKVTFEMLATLTGDDELIDDIDWERYRESEESLDITITVQEIVDTLEDYRGIFAIDFGTTNTCYAYKTIRVRGKDPREAHERPATASGEIPSVVFFQDVHNRENPKYEIGTRAKRLIARNSHQIYAYFVSIKRLLGHSRSFYVLDAEAGRRRENRQEWRAEEIAALVIRRVLEQAQSELAEQKLGTRINEIVATYPTVFSPRRKKAIHEAFELALRGLHERQGSNGACKIRLQIDEANAASFNYVAGPMLDHFFEFARKREETYLLTFDFGGGTIDVSLMRVLFEQIEDDRTAIHTELVGVTGEAFYGGDNVTLEVFELLKRKLALSIAKHRLVEQKEEEVKKREEDLWGDDDINDDWGDEPEAVEEEAVDEEVPPHLADIINDDDRFVDEDNAYLSVLEEIKACRGSLAEELVEGAIVTRWARYANEDPHKELMAKKLFYEIWLEAEKLKLLLVKNDEGSAFVQAPLERVARYGSVEPKVFNDEVEITLEELNAAVEERIVTAIQKAKALVDNGIEMTTKSDEDRIKLAVEPDFDEEDDDFGILKRLGGAKELPRARSYSTEKSKPSFKILLAGNASSLPIVREKIVEIFGVEPRDLIRPEHLKTAVAQGAAEELFMRRQFGSEGFIHFVSKSFLASLPYSVGLYNRHLGFVQVFGRGSEDGATLTLANSACRLIHSELEELALYADYHDGAGPSYLGWIDFSRPNASKQGDVEIGPDDSFAIEFRLLENRNMEARNLRSGAIYDFQQPTEDDLDPAFDPFSGVH